MALRIDRKLNLVLTVEDEVKGSRTVFGDDGKPVLNSDGSPKVEGYIEMVPRAYVHSTPVGRDIFRTFFLTISKVFAAMSDQGPTFVMQMGPRTASLMLERIAKADGCWEGTLGVQKGFLAHIHQSTNVLMRTESGWDMVPYYDAVKTEAFTEEEVEDIENALTFFTVVSLARPTREANDFLETVFGLYGAETTFSNIMEYQASLPISTEGGSTGEKVIASSIPG